MATTHYEIFTFKSPPNFRYRLAKVVVNENGTKDTHLTEDKFVTGDEAETKMTELNLAGV